MAAAPDGHMKAHKKHWFTNDSKLFKSSGELLCDLHMHANSNTGEIRHAGERLHIRHRMRSPRWRLVRTQENEADTMLLIAHKYPASTLAFVVEKYSPEGVVTDRLRIQMRSRFGDDFDVHALPIETATEPTQLSDDEPLVAAPDEGEEAAVQEIAGIHESEVSDTTTNTTETAQAEELELVVTFTAKPHSRKYHVDVHRHVEDEMMSFLFFFFVMMNRVKRFGRSTTGDGAAAAMFAASAPVLITPSAAIF